MNFGKQGIHVGVSAAAVALRKKWIIPGLDAVFLRIQVQADKDLVFTFSREHRYKAR